MESESERDFRAYSFVGFGLMVVVGMAAVVIIAANGWWLQAAVIMCAIIVVAGFLVWRQSQPREQEEPYLRQLRRDASLVHSPTDELDDTSDGETLVEPEDEPSQTTEIDVVIDRKDIKRYHLYPVVLLLPFVVVCVLVGCLLLVMLVDNMPTGATWFVTIALTVGMGYLVWRSYGDIFRSIYDQVKKVKERRTQYLLGAIGLVLVAVLVLFHYWRGWTYGFIGPWISAAVQTIVDALTWLLSDPVHILLTLLVLALGALGVRVLRWLRDVVIITPRSITPVTGLVVLRKPIMDYDNITDLTPTWPFRLYEDDEFETRHPLWARFMRLDIVHVEFETAGQNQGFSEIRYMTGRSYRAFLARYEAATALRQSGA